MRSFSRRPGFAHVALPGPLDVTPHSTRRIVSRPEQLEEGLFGQVLLYVFEILPHLLARRSFPGWHITSMHYGKSPDFRVIPGVFDLAYTPGSIRGREVDLFAMRALHARVIGGDWQAAHDLWHAYFRVPERIVRAANGVGVGQGTLGLHYRGQDKNTRACDTNPVGIDDFLTLARAFHVGHRELERVFVATDEAEFVERARDAFPKLQFTCLGAVPFHKAPGGAAGKADRALLDCVLLSRCGQVLKCSSALSGFAKVLEPRLAIHRVAACKLFADIPYFPDAYIPRLAPSDADGAAILERTMRGDWLDDPVARARYGEPFADRRRRWPPLAGWHWLKYRRRRWLERPRAAPP